MTWGKMFEDDTRGGESVPRYMVVMTAPKRAVLVSPFVGGPTIYSHLVPAYEERGRSTEVAAPTFTRAEVEAIKASTGMFNEQMDAAAAQVGGPIGDGIKNAKIELAGVLVEPDLPGLRASMLACFRAWLNAGLDGKFPGWSDMPEGKTPVLKS